jgi:hypothetical protein
MKRYFVIAFCILSFSSLLAQKEALVGLNFNLERMDNDNFRLGGGLTFEKKLFKRGAIETGLFCRTIQNRTLYTFEISPTETKEILGTTTEYFTSIPLYYKVYSRFVNFSFGANTDFYSGYTFKASDPALKVSILSVKPAVWIGFGAKISKSFQIQNKYILEPELRFSKFINVDAYYAGFGINVRYKWKCKEFE